MYLSKILNLSLLSINQSVYQRIYRSIYLSIHVFHPSTHPLIDAPSRHLHAVFAPRFPWESRLAQSVSGDAAWVAALRRLESGAADFLPARQSRPLRVQRSAPLHANLLLRANFSPSGHFGTTEKSNWFGQVDKHSHRPQNPARYHNTVWLTDSSISIHT